MDFTRIIYRSARAPGLTDEALLRTLIQPAYQRNMRDGITGCLWCGTHSFVQVVEGEPAAVAALMKRIAADPRHHEVTIMSSTVSTARLFEAWGLKWVRSQDCAGVEGLAQGVRPLSLPAMAAVGSVPHGRLEVPATPVPTIHVVRRIIGELVCAEPTYF